MHTYKVTMQKNNVNSKELKPGCSSCVAGKRKRQDPYIQTDFKQTKKIVYCKKLMVYKIYNQGFANTGR